MLTNQVSSKLQSLRLSGMLRGLEEQETMPNISKLNFNERFELLLDREEMVRRNKSLQNRIRKAKFKESACIEDID